MALEIQIRGADRLDETVDRLRQANRTDLLRAMDRGIRKRTKPTVRDIKESAENITTRGIRKPGAKRPYLAGSPSRGTRKKIAGAVSAVVSTAGEEAKVTFRESLTRAGVGNLPRRLDEPGIFRHPVQGNTDVWVGQTGDPWFFAPIKKNLPGIRAGIEEESQLALEKLEAP